jgi:hypothetical protein
MSTTTPVVAKYDGKCPACGTAIIAGTEIEPHDVDEVHLWGTDEVLRRDVLSWQHVSCPTFLEPGEVCSTCFLEKPCPCEDDQ